MDIKRKLTSRKLWMAIAAFVVGVLALLGTDANITQQISGVIMSLGAVVAYIVGEGLVDAAAASTPNVTAQSIAPVIGTVDTTPAEAAQTGADQAAEVKQDTALPGNGKTE